MDRSTRWHEAIPLASTKASACADALLAHWISRFGVPAHLTSNHGPQFESVLPWHHSPSDHCLPPESNWMVERFDCSMKNSLRARCADGSWNQQLPWDLHGLRNTPNGGLASLLRRCFWDHSVPSWFACSTTACQCYCSSFKEGSSPSDLLPYVCLPSLPRSASLTTLHWPVPCTPAFIETFQLQVGT